MDLQSIIRSEVRRQGVSGYRLGKLSGVPMRAVQRYLAGDTDTAGANVGRMLEALGFTLRRPARKVRR